MLISENCILGSSVAYFLRYSLGWRVSSEMVDIEMVQTEIVGNRFICVFSHLQKIA